MRRLQKSARNLKQKRDGIISKIQANPILWQSQYLPQLRVFIQEVYELSREDYNYPEVVIVIGEQVSLDRSGKEGILQKLSNYIDRLVEKAEANLLNQQKILQWSNKKPRCVTDVQGQTSCLHPIWTLCFFL